MSQNICSLEYSRGEGVCQGDFLVIHGSCEVQQAQDTRSGLSSDFARALPVRQSSADSRSVVPRCEPVPRIRLNPCEGVRTSSPEPSQGFAVRQRTNTIINIVFVTTSCGAAAFVVKSRNRRCAFAFSFGNIIYTLRPQLLFACNSSTAAWGCRPTRDALVLRARRGSVPDFG